MVVRWLVGLLLTLSGMAWAGNTLSPSSIEQWRLYQGKLQAPTISSGCAPTVPGASMTLGAFACVGFVTNTNGALTAISQDAVAFTLPSSGAGTYWLMIYQDTSTDPGSWTRSDTSTTKSSHYRVQKSATMPTAPAGGLIFASVTVDATPVVTAITLLRTTVIDLVEAGGCSGCSAATNTAALQAAATAAQAVYIPPGTYHINAAIAISNKSFRLLGAGRGVSILVQDTASTNGLTYTSTSDTTALEVDHLTLQAGVAAAGNAISATWTAIGSSVAARAQLHDLEITWVTSGTHYWTNGIVLTDAWNSTIHHNTIELKPPVGQTFNAGSAISLLGESNDVLIAHNFLYHAQYGLLVGGTTEGVAFTDNVVVSVDTGVNLSTAAAEPGKSVSRNHISAFSAAISLDARTDTEISNNLLYKHSASTQNWSGIILQATATGSDWAHIHDNNMGGTGAGGTENGVVLGRSTWSIITNNTCHDMDGTCVWLQANASTNTVANNRQNGLASTLTIHASATANVLTNNQPPDAVTSLTQNSTTPSIANSATNAFITNNTNPTTITALQNGYVGQVISIRAADANTTLTHGGTIFLRNGQTYAMPNGGTIILRFDGTNWYELGPQFPLLNSTGVIQAGQARIVADSATLTAGTVTVTLTNNAVFTGSTSYKCTCADVTAAAACRMNQTSGSQFTITGTGTDTINYICVGN